MFVLFDLICGLNKGATVTAAGHEGVIAGGALNVVLLSGLATQHHNWDAGGDTTKKEIKESTFSQLLRIRVD